MTNIESLIAGFARFREKYFEGEDNLYRRLKNAQSPSTLVVACCDSRVDPAILLDAAPGELFVVRNVANLVPPHAGDSGTHGVSAALEFAVCTLKVADIVILGHSQCGGIGALMNGAAGEYITRWMDIAREAAVPVDASAAGRAGESAVRACEQRSIVLSLRNLMTFPFVRQRVESGQLNLHGWYFDLSSGEIDVYSRDRDEFRAWANKPQSKG